MVDVIFSTMRNASTMIVLYNGYFYAVDTRYVIHDYSWFYKANRNYMQPL